MSDARSLADLLHEIHQLREGLALCRQALTPFSDMSQVYPRADNTLRLLSAWGGREVAVADLRRAADVLRALEAAGV